MGNGSGKKNAARPSRREMAKSSRGKIMGTDIPRFPLRPLAIPVFHLSASIFLPLSLVAALRAALNASSSSLGCFVVQFLIFLPSIFLPKSVSISEAHVWASLVLFCSHPWLMPLDFCPLCVSASLRLCVKLPWLLPASTLEDENFFAHRRGRGPFAAPDLNRFHQVQFPRPIRVPPFVNLVF